MCCFFFWERAQTLKLKSVKEKETQVQPCTQLPQRHLTFTKACTAVLKKVLQTKQCRSLTPQCRTRLELLPSPAARLDVDGLVGGEGRAVGAGMAVTGYPLQRQVLRVHRQTHPAQQRHTHAQHSRRGEWTDGRAEGVREEEAGWREEDGGSDEAEHRRDSSRRRQGEEESDRVGDAGAGGAA